MKKDVEKKELKHKEEKNTVIQKEEEQKIELSVEKVFELAFDKTIAYKKLMTYYKCALMEVETKFKVLAEEYSLQHDRNPIAMIKSRIKSFDSIIEKLERRGLDISVGDIERNLFDIAGIRIICSFESDVYMLAQSFLMQDDINLIQKKDYIGEPKGNGYRSLHLIISVPIFLELEKKEMKVEVQIRTIAMDCWAELEHQLRYKKENKLTDDMQYELLTCANLGKEIDKRMEGLKDELLT